MNYNQKLRDPKWQKKRLEILNRDKFTCRLCSDTKTTLHVHHLKYKGNPWDVNNEDLVALCEHCHPEVEYLKKIIKDFNFNNVSFYKATSLDNKGWMIFSAYGTELTQSIYKNGVRVDGFVFNYYIASSLEVLINKVKVNTEEEEPF